jgi:N6-adenosine-specific RNA methylase IME4
MFDGLPRNHFGAILADPPWPFKTWSAKGQRRSAEAHYQTMSHEDLRALPVGDLALPDAVLFLWIVQTQIPQALRVVKAWGFTLKSVAFIWKKGSGLPLFPDDVVHQMGMGKWTRAGTEQCWLATRGKPKRLAGDVRQIILEQRREHSRKPDAVHNRIEQLVKGPYLELFARQSRLGWTTWGDEATKFDKPYDAQDDFAKSLQYGYDKIRERVADGGQLGFMQEE